MFQSLRIGTPLYVLHKNVPKLEVGEVTFVSNPAPQFGTTYGAGYQMQQPTVVDVKIKCGEQAIELKQLPANQTIADYGNGMVISESKDGILTEIDTLRKNSMRVLESIDHHKELVKQCESFIAELNPQVKIEAERSQEIAGLKDEVNGLKDDMTDIKGMLTKLLNKKNKED